MDPIEKSEARLDAWVSGRVQGVGFRYWTRDLARRLGLRGSATNLPDGRVAIVAEGDRGACEALLRALAGDAAPGHVTGVQQRWGVPGGEPPAFRVR
jgi:acylphosphatase